MAKICLNTRDDMLFIDLDKMAFAQANGNYTELTYISGQKQMITTGLSKIEDFIRASFTKGSPSPFVRMGRSLIINQTYLYAINILRQKLVLSDFNGHAYSISVPKQLLKEYKKVMAEKLVPKA